jgi:hypothetical protein
VHELVSAFHDASASSCESRRLELRQNGAPEWGAATPPPAHSAHDARGGFQSGGLKKEGRWERIRRQKIGRLIGISFPDAVSAFKAFGGFSGGRSISLSRARALSLSLSHSLSLTHTLYIYIYIYIYIFISF